ncbi:MAG: PilZ domain-containing protein [Candidatus Aureabacteria bacterium]|nr:PilZ domain-containing protein [Candidatus Auribacterota bacterium]
MVVLKKHAPERRQNIRIPFWSIIRYRINDNGSIPISNNKEVVYGNSLNLSVGGLCFETFESINVGNNLDITLALPTYPLRKLVISGTVLRCEKINLTELYTVALSFKNVQKQDSFAFAEFIEHFLN